MSGLNTREWSGIATSLLVHLALLGGMAACHLEPQDTQAIGYMEVDFGEFAEGRPVEPAVQEQPADPAPDPVPEEPEPTPETPQAPPEEAKPVDVPDQPQEVMEEEIIEDPQTETIAPEPPAQEAEEEAPTNTPEETVPPLGGEPTDGETGAETGVEGEGNDEEKAAPFNIEGLNRTPVSTELPRYAEKVNATIRIRITVDPQGRVVRRIPLLKGNPSLEQAVMDALQRWRFNPLPPNAPQESQTGVVTFVFRLE